MESCCWAGTLWRTAEFGTVLLMLLNRARTWSLGWAALGLLVPWALRFTAIGLLIGVISSGQSTAIGATILYFPCSFPHWSRLSSVTRLLASFLPLHLYAGLEAVLLHDRRWGHPPELAALLVFSIVLLAATRFAYKGW